jgi:hypothetical protein
MSSPKPDLGRIGIWAGDLDNYPVADLRAAATAIEHLGYGTLWFPRRPAGRPWHRPGSCCRPPGGSLWPPVPPTSTHATR